ncbi:DUF7344 domain-containing protein [Halalkalirubrum salinum]|uniref:DUF7344 domain-containing protein n=1 Tax=Halalkalirubrum salinum TaxID=2563889 RepID=UPI0010FB7A50|nr:hypothetical protein [Halalkalirubrum salinum]
MPPVDQKNWNQIYTALAREERRELLRYLQHMQKAQLEDVAQHLLEWEHGSTEEDFSAIRLGLYHMHLPKLAEAGLLTWDSQQNQITLTTLGTQLPAEFISPILVPSINGGNRGAIVD